MKKKIKASAPKLRVTVKSVLPDKYYLLSVMHNGLISNMLSRNIADTIIEWKQQGIAAVISSSVELDRESYMRILKISTPGNPKV